MTVEALAAILKDYSSRKNRTKRARSAPQDQVLSGSKRIDGLSDKTLGNTAKPRNVCQVNKSAAKVTTDDIRGCHFVLPR